MFSHHGLAIPRQSLTNESYLRSWCNVLFGHLDSDLVAAGRKLTQGRYKQADTDVTKVSAGFDRSVTSAAHSMTLACGIEQQCQLDDEGALRASSRDLAVARKTFADNSCFRSGAGPSSGAAGV